MHINYLLQIKAFFEQTQLQPIPTGQVALWYALMAVNNKCAWREWFTVSILTLRLATGLSRSGVIKARNALKQRGLIDFKSASNSASSYKMISLTGENGAVKVDGEKMSEDAAESTQSEALNKQNKNETKQVKRDTPVSQKEDVLKAFSEGDNALYETLLEFERMRKKIKKPVTARGWELLFSKLLTLSGGDRLKMIRILEQSIAGSYQGVFPLKSGDDAGDIKTAQTSNPFLKLLKESEGEF